MITTKSTDEQQAVKLAFRDMQGGERVVTHLVSTLHSKQTLKQILMGPSCEKSFRHLTVAFKWRKTGLRVEESVQNAMDSAPNENISNHIKNEW